ncbi:DUF2334 domain-containing protein [Gracilibacillus sp. S3-1-1]|uniref:DUF2334 domain-containing protein n=1 Tax=Gracilibacillus pellucidus TaxID=3095368 RepID=A0ACC6M642_9BACI|nr:DUF2334 domain-containing protein [Gracilibacillus sp. S3-1-1]MDX8046440.1 DUF2334 domain-containing protein [Gracilibacillus sp. S3-1-1]
MIYKKNYFILMLFVLFFANAGNLSATIDTHSLDQRDVTLIYHEPDELAQANVYFLDSTLSGLFQHVQVMELDKLDKSDIAKADIVMIYLPKAIDEEKLSIFEDVSGMVVGIGAGATTLPAFTGWQFNKDIIIDQLDETYLTYPESVVVVEDPEPEQVEVVAEGRRFDKTYQVIVKNEEQGFIGLDSLLADGEEVISRIIFDLLDIEKPSTHPAYIRLEDISPVSDPKLVQEAGNYLLDRGIPVYLATIPVFVDSNSGVQVTLEERPELLKVLQELVDKGAYIISHGYTHSYRYSETGEGFEFWDTELNQPITTVDQHEHPVKLKSVDEFSNLQAYETYIAQFKEIEQEYVEMKLENSVHYLTKIGLAPIAFEAPHYTMSSNGYRVTSNYFSAIFGQIQASDVNWELMVAPMFISRPSVLHGMTLYPETIGYVNDTAYTDPITVMEQRIEEVLEVPGSVLGGFYHPYLGIEYLEEMVRLLEQVPNLEWIDLSQSDNHVKTDLVEVTTSGGDIEVQQLAPFPKEKKNWLNKIEEAPFEFALWVIVVVTALFIGLFTIHLSTLRLRYRKRLFRERA